MGDYIDFMKMGKKDSNIPVILWGAGHYYNTVKDYIKYSIAVDYIHDKKWDDSTITEFDGYPVISLAKLKNIGRCAILSCFRDRNIEEDVYNEISMNIPDAQIYSVKNLIPIGRNLRKEEIIERSAWGGNIKTFMEITSSTAPPIH